MIGKKLINTHLSPYKLTCKVHSQIKNPRRIEEYLSTTEQYN